MSLIPFTFNKVALQVVTIDGKEWCRGKEICKALGYKKDRAHVVRGHVSGENVAHEYISEDRLYKLVFSRQQPLAKAFRKHCCNVIFLHIQQQLI